MNKRIKELAEQAGIPAIDGEWDYNDRTLLVKDNDEWRAAVPSEIISTMIQSEQGLKKFAELIVQECANVVSAGISNATDWDSSYWDQACENRAQAIKKHFGVEE